MQPLKGKIAVVAGATRGTGRGIACMLGAAGATVYCTGRSTRANRPAQRRTDLHPDVLANRPETIEETAELVTAQGGLGLPVQVDHTEPEQVAALFERVKRDYSRLDLLVNDIWGGDELMESKPFWEHSLQKGLLMLERAVHSHIVTSHYAAPLMLQAGRGLIVEITDGNHFGYRGQLYYDLVKTTIIRLAFALAAELKPHNISVLALTPGFIRSEAILEQLGVTEANWREAVKDRPDFIESETPFYIGRIIAALAADPKVGAKTGRVYAAWDLGPEYGVTDVDGRQPNILRWIEANLPEYAWKKCDDPFYAYWTVPPVTAATADQEYPSSHPQQD